MSYIKTKEQKLVEKYCKDFPNFSDELIIDNVMVHLTRESAMFSYQIEEMRKAVTELVINHRSINAL